MSTLTSLDQNDIHTGREKQSDLPNRPIIAIGDPSLQDSALPSDGEKADRVRSGLDLFVVSEEVAAVEVADPSLFHVGTLPSTRPRALSPAELDQVNGVGIHDEDVIADLEDIDLEPTCHARPAPDGPECCALASHWLRCRTCLGFVTTVCPSHAAAAEASVSVRRHNICGALARMNELVEVIKL